VYIHGCVYTHSRSIHRDVYTAVDTTVDTAVDSAVDTAVDNTVAVSSHDAVTLDGDAVGAGPR
jgi:hypothetical protein